MISLPQPRDARGRLRSPYLVAPGWRLCPACQQERPEEQFTPKRRDPQSGAVTLRQARCLECWSAAMRAWRERNTERYRAYERARYQADPAHHIAQRRAWRERNQDAPRRWRRAYYERHRDEVLARTALYAAKTTALRTGRNRMWRAVEQGQRLYPRGFVLVRIEDVNDWRPARPGVPLRRCEFALAEFVHDGEQWKMLACPVVDSALRHWLPRLRRGLIRREKLKSGGIVPETGGTTKGAVA